MTQLALYFLGAPRLELDGKAVFLSHHKATALLAYLAVTGQRHTRPALAALLWPGHDAVSARGELRRMIWVVKKSLGQGWLETDQQTVRLPAHPDLWLDVACFRERLAASQQHNHLAHETCPSCLESLTEAVNLAQGDFLAGFTLPDSPDFDAWQTFETENLRRELAGGLERLVHLLAGGEKSAVEQAIAYARRWLALDPLHEPAHRQLMRLYAQAGDPATAVQQYQSCVQVMAQELGIAPTAETTALFEAIKANQGLAGTGIVVEKRPSLPPASPPPHNLPIQATSFIGREAALDGLQQRLADPDVRLITIIGPGGIGKTRLSLALAERQLQSATAFSDGVFFISLAPIRSADMLIQTIAEGLAFPLASAEEPAMQLLTYLRHKHMLLVLDNFEHLLDGVVLVSRILQTAVHVKIVVTSRERLNLANETLWPIGGLNFSRLTSVETALADEAVQLFTQRARRVWPEFALRPDDLPRLERILQGVWGMPLAIELAAAWLNMLSLAEIAAELSHSLDLLEGELRDVPNRHRSMRLVFDRSWEQLTEEEQALFKALSIFRGGFTREAARQITGASLRGLAGLVNKSLLTSQPDNGRYELHELLRQYAEEKLDVDPPVRTAMQRAHAAYYANLMEASWADLRSARQLTALAAIEQDIENIRAAWHHWLSEKNTVELLKFMDSFYMVYDIRGWNQAAIALFQEAARQISPLSGDGAASLVHGKALGYEGYFTGIIGNPERGSLLSTEGVALIRLLKQPEALLYALYSAALSHLYLNNFAAVIAAAQEWRQIGVEIGDRWGETVSLNFTAVALVGQKQIGEAQEKVDQALQIFSQEIGEYFGLSWAALVRGRVALSLGTYAEAKPFYDRSLAAAQALGYRRTIQQSYDNLGDVAFFLGEFDQAERYFRLSLEVSEETGQNREMIGTLYDLARVWAMQGKKVEAVVLLAVVLCHSLSKLPLFLRTEQPILSEAAERLRASLEDDLGLEEYQAAWSQGQTLPLEVVVAGLLG